MSTQAGPRKHVNLHELRRMKDAGEKIAVVTAYDATMARLVDAAGVDAVLVGDSLGMVVLGYPDTTHVTMAEMEHHVRAVARARPRAFASPSMVSDASTMSPSGGPSLPSSMTFGLHEGWRPLPATPRRPLEPRPLLPSGPGGVDGLATRGDRQGPPQN